MQLCKLDTVTMKARMLLGASFVFLTVLLAGCQPPFLFRLFNNTGVDIAVYLDNGIVWNWRNATVLRIEDKTVTLEGDEVEASLDQVFWKMTPQPMLQIGYGSRVMTYQFSQSDDYGFALWPGIRPGGLPAGYDAEATAGSQYYYQLEPDRKLYAVRSGETFPAENLLRQPRGFPLTPTAIQQ